MKNKIILTSVIAIMTAMPAMAEPSHTSSTFPSNEYMLEDYTYTNQANYTNMGVYSDSVNANADYSDCPANSYCDGTSQTPVACSTVGDTTFTLSAEGSTANTDCYKACNVNNMGNNGSIATIAHATALTGNDYYGSGTDTCEPTACENGWHVKAAAPDLMTVIGASEAGTGSGYLSDDGEDSSNTSTYGITHNGEFVVDYGNKGKVHGYARCSTRGVENMWYNNDGNTFESDHFTATLPDSTGQYCYCQLDGYTPNGSSLQSLSAPWVFNRGYVYYAGECATDCAYNCANYLRNDGSNGLAFRAAVFGVVESGPAACEANTITINWSDASTADINANNAGTVTYGGDIRTPQAAALKPGKVFVGWKFVKPNQQ